VDAPLVLLHRTTHDACRVVARQPRLHTPHVHRLQPDEAVLLDMGLWEHQGPPPTTPASPHNGYARQCAPAQHSQALPGAMPLWQPGRPSQPGGAEGSAGAAAGCADSKGAPPPPRSPTTPAGEAAAGGGGWGLWHAAGSSAGGACDSSACQHNSNAGGVQRLRLYQILHPSLADRALVWGNTLSLRGAWVCKDGPYFDAPAALFFSLCAGGGSSGSGSGSSAPASLCPPASSSITSSKGPVDMVGMWQLKSHLHHPHQQQARGSTSTAYTIPTAHSHAVRASSAAGGLLRTGSAAAPAAALPGLRLKCSSATAACTCGPEAPAGAPAPQQVSGLRTPSAADVEVRLQDQRGQQAQHVPCVLALQLPCSVHGSYVVTAGATTCGSSAPSCATAPGAPLGAPRPGVPRSLLPPVTLLFVGVEGAKLLRKQLVRDAHCCLSGLMMEAMRAVPGGYMCRMQVRLSSGCGLVLSQVWRVLRCVPAASVTTHPYTRTHTHLVSLAVTTNDNNTNNRRATSSTWRRLARPAPRWRGRWRCRRRPCTSPTPAARWSDVHRCACVCMEAGGRCGR
jgi:hypothetical protein